MDILIAVLLFVIMVLPFYVGFEAYKEGKRDGIKEEKLTQLQLNERNKK